MLDWKFECEIVKIEDLVLKINSEVKPNQHKYFPFPGDFLTDLAMMISFLRFQVMLEVSWMTRCNISY